MSSAKLHIACFVSPHGFGHAARASAVMSSLHASEPGIQFDIFTSVPRWFFADSLTGSFSYHHLLTDIGLAQKSSLEEDVPETIRRLDGFIPFNSDLVHRLAQAVNRLGCRLVLCDIAPLGIAGARVAGIPSVLIENFTWDWIYRPYARLAPRMKTAISYLRTEFRRADYHIQTEPVCCRGQADLVTPPVSRTARTSRREIRRQLGIPGNKDAVLITMGGIPEQHRFLDQLAAFQHVHFVIPGASDSEIRRGNLVLLPHRSRFFHPDLVNACNAVIGKSGYSTVAEVFHSGVPLGYVSRSRFPESRALARFIQARMRGFEIHEADFSSGAWLKSLPDLLMLGRMERRERNGANIISQFILDEFQLSKN